MIDATVDASLRCKLTYLLLDVCCLLWTPESTKSNIYLGNDRDFRWLPNHTKICKTMEGRKPCSSEQVTKHGCNVYHDFI